MGSTPSKSKYLHSNLVVEYYFNLNAPQNRVKKFIEITGQSLFEFHPDSQDLVLSDLKHLICDGDEVRANTFNQYLNVYRFGKLFVFCLLIGCGAIIMSTIYELIYFPLIYDILFIIIASAIYISSLLILFYCLYFTNKLKKKQLNRWRQSIITKISTKTLEWHQTNQSFSFSVIYPIGEQKHYDKKREIDNLKDIGGIVRITYGEPKYTRNEPIYFKAGPGGLKQKKPMLEANKPRLNIINHKKYHSMIDMNKMKPNIKLEEIKNNKKYKPIHRGSQSAINIIQKPINNINNINKKQPNNHNQVQSMINNLESDINDNNIDKPNNCKWKYQRVHKNSNLFNDIDDLELEEEEENKYDINNEFDFYNNKKKIQSVSHHKVSNSGSHIFKPYTFKNKSNRDKHQFNEIMKVRTFSNDSLSNYNNQIPEIYEAAPGMQQIHKKNIELEESIDLEEVEINNDINIAIHGDDNDKKNEKLLKKKSKNIPIMIRGINGTQILLSGIKQIINGEEVIVIDNGLQPQNIDKGHHEGPVTPIASPIRARKNNDELVKEIIY